MKTITEQQIDKAAARYPRAVTGPMQGCKHPAALLRHVLEHGNPSCRRLAENYITSGHGACWNALCNIMPVSAWLVWYCGDKN